MSRAFLGIQIDAVYHTSLVFGGIEYFYGAGVQTSYPGRTHHGAPMETIPLGKTELDLEIVLEYLESLKEVYTAESYDLFMHNCNNFSHDFAMFLLGRGIPDHITSLPQTVLNTPFGQMLKPQLDSAMRGITQAPVAPAAVPASARVSSSTAATRNNHGTRPQKPTTHAVHNVTRLSELNTILEAAKSSCAVIFFTSSTCAPCKICYPAYDSLAAELGDKVTLIKVDLNFSPDIGPRYQIRGTPTFMTFLHDEKVEEWSGADASKLLSNVRLLVQMAHPPHPHLDLRLPELQRSTHAKPVTYAKVPPIDKLISKLGDKGTDAAVLDLKAFVEARFSTEPKANAPIPNLRAVSLFVQSNIEMLPPSDLFALVDLWRLALVDPRVSGYFAEEEVAVSTILALITKVNDLGESCPYSLRIVTIQAACNLFTSNLYPPRLIGDSVLASPLIALLASSLLDETHAPVRVAAASLAFNISQWISKQREAKRSDGLSEGSQVELAASLLEAIGRETNADSLKGLLLALGLLAYTTKQDGEVKDVLAAMDASDGVLAKKTKENSELVYQVAMVVK